MVKHDGYLKATNAKIIGDITASSGTIGGWTIGTLAVKTSFIASNDKKNNPNVLLSSVGTMGTVQDATGELGSAYYVGDRNNQNINNWIFLSGRVSPNSLQYRFGIR